MARRFPRAEIDRNIPLVNRNIRDGLGLLVSCFAGQVAPLEPYEGTVWMDTSDGSVRQYHAGQWRRMDISPKAKATDQTFTSDVVADVSGLSSPVVAGASYAIRALIVQRSDTATRGLRFALTVPSGSDFAATARALESNAEAAFAINASGEEAVFARVPEANADSVVEIVGALTTTTAGDVVLRAGCETAGNVVTVRRGSFLHVERTA